MKEDIPVRKVTDVAIAIVPDKKSEEDIFWYAYLINLKPDPIDTIIITTRGYGYIDGKRMKTSELRHVVKKLDARSYVRIEPIDEEVLRISNEFWISFWHKGILYDKKYVFVAESLSEDNFTTIPLVNKKGVMIK